MTKKAIKLGRVLLILSGTLVVALLISYGVGIVIFWATPDIADYVPHEFVARTCVMYDLGPAVPWVAVELGMYQQSAIDNAGYDIRVYDYWRDARRFANSGHGWCGAIPWSGFLGNMQDFGNQLSGGFSDSEID